MNDHAMLEVVNCMHLRTIPAETFVFEHGSLGEEFFLILKGQVEIQIPDKEQAARFEAVKFDLRQKKEALDSALSDIEQFDEYSRKLEEKKALGDAAEASNSLFKQDRRYTRVIVHDIPKASMMREEKIRQLAVEIDRLCAIKNYELMVPVVLYGAGKAFGELALTKDVNAPNRILPRAASVLCSTDCTFAVMNKADYQNVLDHIDRKKIEKIKEFFAEIPFLRHLPKNTFKSLHLSMHKKVCHRGQVIAREGEDSSKIFIIYKGEFEVSKTIVNNSEQKKKKNTGH